VAVSANACPEIVISITIDAAKARFFIMALFPYVVISVGIAACKMLTPIWDCNAPMPLNSASERASCAQTRERRLLL
jgi:hypothetical protein